MDLHVSFQDVVKEYVELSFDKLPGLMEEFRDLLTGKGPAVIYSHCEVCMFVCMSVCLYVDVGVY